ncbi:LysR family transcriptional regulator [Rhizobium rhizogenes]|uniref:LysR family transcriptional regulator n=1 Tax=Rhizobium rhizogenes TaxID=359 RepID=UPI00157487AA|nr:LysR family transcriptional regulator [Rhizobium rhizogenes]NTF96105.1 LysR family transcriptional regulator [Rhizobium rhizogenes]
MNEINLTQPAGVPVIEWPIHAEEMTPEALVREAAALLDAICLRLGSAADRRLLLDGLRYCLKTSGAVTTLSEDFRDRTRRNLSRSLQQISNQIQSWAEAASGNRSEDRVKLIEPPMVRFEFESLCAGHKWEEPVSRLLHRSDGGRMTMQLYNEWVHQLVIVRDISLPFQDWRERPLWVAEPGDNRGIRRFEPLRRRFHSEIISQLPPERSLAHFRAGIEGLSSRDPTHRRFPRSSAAATAMPSAASHPLIQGRMLDNELLRVFLTVVRCGSFTVAAKMMNRTQAAVSMQIKRLEEIVQVRLLSRENRLFQLTAEGQTLRDYAQRLLDLHDEALTSLSAHSASGPVRLATNEFLASTLFPALSARFRERYPDSWLEIRLIPVGSLGSRLGATDDDLVLDILPAGSPGAFAIRPVFLNWYTCEQCDPSRRTPVPLATQALDGLIASRMTQVLDRSGLK